MSNAGGTGFRRGGTASSDSRNSGENPAVPHPVLGYFALMLRQATFFVIGAVDARTAHRLANGHGFAAFGRLVEYHQSTSLLLMPVRLVPRQRAQALWVGLPQQKSCLPCLMANYLQHLWIQSSPLPAPLHTIMQGRTTETEQRFPRRQSRNIRNCPLRCH